MTIYTIGFTKKNAEQFFETLKKNEVQMLVDVRLNNKSQLAGFTKDGDIQYFLNLCGIKYTHCDEFAPSKELLKGYQAGDISWDQYTAIFNEILDKRKVCARFYNRFKEYDNVCLLCSEATAEQCHRRLVAEKIKKETTEPIEIIHL